MVLTITRTKKCVNVTTLAGLRGLFRQIERRRSKQSTSCDSYELICIEVKEDKIFVPRSLERKDLAVRRLPLGFQGWSRVREKESLFRYCIVSRSGRCKI